MRKNMSQSNKNIAIARINSQLDKLRTAKRPLEDYLYPWKDRTIRMLINVIVEEELNLFADISGDTWDKEALAYDNFLVDILEGVNKNPDFFLIKDQLDEPKTLKTKANIKAGTSKSNKIFIVHGHDSLTKTEVARTLEQLDLEAIILHEQPNEGKTIIEKFERDASQVSFSVVILTPDDIGYPKNKEKDAKPRARQNVVLELGYFSGILGRSNVCVLYKGGVEIPSDYLGVIYIPIDEDGAWKYKLSRKLKQAGLEIDLNKLI